MKNRTNIFTVFISLVLSAAICGAETLRVSGIYSVLSVELFAVLKNKEAFNEGRYVYNLHRLPELPFEESNES